MTACVIDLQLDTTVAASELPQAIHFQTWADKAVNSGQPLQQQFKQQFKQPREITIRIVDEEESRQLNFNYRQQNKATNVLSFAIEVPAEIDLPLLGDLVICAPVVIREAAEQNKPAESHWAHMVIHGILHLQGFDHVVDADAKAMENLEVKLLRELGYQNPYD